MKIYEVRLKKRFGRCFECIPVGVCQDATEIIKKQEKKKEGKKIAQLLY